jgi:hypothetical protein
MIRRYRHIVRPALAVAVVSICMCGAFSEVASAMGSGPGWELTASSLPTSMPPGGEGNILVKVINIGAGASSGTTTVTDILPEGVKAVEAGGVTGAIKGYGDGIVELDSEWQCGGDGLGGGSGVDGASVVTCTSNEAREGYVGIVVSLPEGELLGTNRVSIAGGGAPTSASTTDPISVTSKQAPFGFEGWDVWFSNADGTLDTQAGSHPYEAFFNYDLRSVLDEDEGWSASGGKVGQPPMTRNIEVKLPPGFVGDPNAAPFCTRQQFDAEACPAATQIGIITLTAVGGLVQNKGYALYNLVPPAGVPDEFGLNFEGVQTRFDTGVRSGSDYGLTTHVDNIPEKNVISSLVTLWGVPGEHDGQGERKPFLTLPTSCTGSLKFTIATDTWGGSGLTDEKSVLTHDSNGHETGLTGCEYLTFGPPLAIAPDTGQADTPAGLTVEVKPPVGGLENPEGFGTSDIKNTTVTLPEGVVINPGQAAGLEACQQSEAHIHVENSAPECPLKSKVGTVEAELPILKDPLKGNVYVLQSNPPNLELLLAASGDGVELKFPIHVHLNEATGQLTATLIETPQAPVSNFKLSFSGGAQAALATPTHCGTYTATSDFTPWASPFVADVSPTGSFAVTSGADGAPCPGAVLPFTPSMIAGSTTDQAGGFTDFSLLLQTPDDQQRIEKLQFKVPQGLLGMISQVPLCEEPQAAAGTCSAASQIGHTVVASGPGPYPLVVPQPGQPPAPIYLTGPYKGAPYGLAIVVPVVVGPFTLETQIVRAKIEVDPLTAQITVTTDALPQVIDGVPTDLRTVNAVIDRPGFMFNPTNCSPLSFSGAAFSAQGASAPISSHFQMGSCRSLVFKPDLVVSTSGKTSRKNGASLDAKIVYPTTPLGANQASSQSNIKSVKVDLPKQLPSRLTTLQKACPSATFEANPASCPADSRVGTVSAVTPVLPVTLTGPAYFVSYGGAKFPELVFALQGYGVTIYVHGETFISKAGITSSTFHQVPDVPIYKFELILPQGPFSALAANGNLCKSTLKMPTQFVAQDGATIKQTTPVNVTGCPKAKKAKGKAKKSGHGSSKVKKGK